MNDYFTNAQILARLVPRLMHTAGGALRCSQPNTSPAHLRLLSLLAERPHHLNELAEKQSVTPATISNTAAALVERGWVERLPEGRDRRLVEVAITPLGREVLAGIGEQLVARFAALLEPLSADEMAGLGTGLAALEHALAAQEEAGCEPGGTAPEWKNKER